MTFKWFYLVRRNPAVTEAEWPRAWRAHAVFASQYPVIGAEISNLLYCSRLFAPTLNGAPFDPPQVTRDYDGVGVVATAARLTGGDLSPEHRDKIFADERRAFSATTDTSSLYAKERFVDGGAPGQAAVIRFVARNADSTPDAFLTRLNGTYADIGTQIATAIGAVRYVHNEVTEPPPPGFPFDAVTEMWFATPEEATRSLADPAQVTLQTDLNAFSDASRSIALLTKVVHRWPRAAS